jgi:hypothetical protein
MDLTPQQEKDLAALVEPAKAALNSEDPAAMHKVVKEIDKIGGTELLKSIWKSKG